jgi:hypothetical protein
MSLRGLPDLSLEFSAGLSCAAGQATMHCPDTLGHTHEPASPGIRKSLPSPCCQWHWPHLHAHRRSWRDSRAACAHFKPLRTSQPMSLAPPNASDAGESDRRAVRRSHSGAQRSYGRRTCWRALTVVLPSRAPSLSESPVIRPHAHEHRSTCARLKRSDCTVEGALAAAEKVAPSAGHDAQHAPVRASCDGQMRACVRACIRACACGFGGCVRRPACR